MDKRSYLDSLNAGRARRPQPTLEQLNRSLEHLEKQLDIRAAQKPDAYQSNRRRLADETAYYGAGNDHRPRPASPADGEAR
jgi:localization factor PodJL